MDNTEFYNLPQNQSTPYSPPTHTVTHKIQNITKDKNNHQNSESIKNIKYGNNFFSELKDKKQFSTFSPFLDQNSNQYINTIPGFENENDDFDFEKFSWSRNIQNDSIGR
jgi:alpha-acetolactate decarboxylase